MLSMDVQVRKNDSWEGLSKTHLQCDRMITFIFFTKL